MTRDEVREQLRFLSAVQHEANTPLAVIRGWADTFVTMWDGLTTADRERAVTSIQRNVGEVIDLLDALFVELRADAHAHAPADAASPLAEVVPEALGHIRDVELDGAVPAVTVGVDPDALEMLLGAAAIGLRMRGGASVAVTVEEDADGALITLSTVGTARVPGLAEPDAFDPFPGGDSSPSGIRLYAARRLAEAAGGRLTVSSDGRLRLRLPVA